MVYISPTNSDAFLRKENIMIYTVSSKIKLAHDWSEKLDQIMQLEDIPSYAEVTAYYSAERDETIILIRYEREF